MLTTQHVPLSSKPKFKLQKNVSNPYEPKPQSSSNVLLVYCAENILHEKTLMSLLIEAAMNSFLGDTKSY